MTEKLLCKPPFRYLHDIFTATLAKTGFGEGLFQGEELNSKAYEDKDSKLSFLVKLISLIESVIGEKLDIKPSAVLAGQNADKTNVMLQQLFRAATAGVDTSPHVAQILGLGGEEGDGGEADAHAEEQARQQAEAEEMERQRQEAEAKAEKKRRHDEKKKRQQQQEEQERQRLEYER